MIPIALMLSYERVISRMKRGKAAGLDNIKSEHLQFSYLSAAC